MEGRSESNPSEGASPRTEPGDIGSSESNSQEEASPISREESADLTRRHAESTPREAALASYGGFVEVKHPNSLWRRDLVYEAKGLRLEVRPMTPDDDLRETAFFNAMSMRERLLRFLGVKNQLLPAEVRQLTHLDFERDFALVAVDRKTDSLAGIARYCTDRADPTVAEVAVAVLQKYQRLGIGRYLVSALFSAAREHGVATLAADILRENTASRSLFEKVAAEVGAKKSLAEVDFDVFTYHYTLPNPEPSPVAACNTPQEVMTPDTQSDIDDDGEPSTPAFSVDDSRHPRSLWRHDLVFESGLRLDVRPADPDDEVRVRHFARRLEASGHAAAMQTLAHVDFTSGFQIIAIDTSKDELVGAARFHRGQDTFSLNVLVDPDFKGLGISDFLTRQVMRAAEKEVLSPAKRPGSGVGN